MTPEQRTLRARIGGLTTAARGHTNTTVARETFLSRFEVEVDPDRSLAPADRARRAEAARKAYFARLALRSSITRKRKAVTVVQTPVTAEEMRRASGEPQSGA